MMHIKTFQCNMLQENAYVAYDETGDAVVIDCGAYYDEERSAIVSFLRDNQLTLRHVLCTHGHFDHCFGNDTLFEAFGLKPEVHADDEFLAANLSEQALELFGMPYSRPTPPVGHLLSDGDVVSFGNHSFRVLHTPGHTPGGVVFYCEEEAVAFTGDTLFRMSVGRTDLARGSWEDLMHSLHSVLAQLPEDTNIYPGHGPKTTIGEELQGNPYLRISE